MTTQQQKEDLKAITQKLTMTKYDEANPEERRAVMQSLLGRYMDTLTLVQLQDLHRGQVLMHYVRDKIREARKE